MSEKCLLKAKVGSLNQYTLTIIVDLLTGNKRIKSNLTQIILQPKITQKEKKTIFHLYKLNYT